MKLPRIIAEWLRERGACNDQVAIFAAEWGPDGADWTEANLRRAVALGLDIEWLAETTLSASDRKAFDEAVAPHRKAFEEAMDADRKAFDEALVQDWKAFEEAVAQDWKVFNEAVAQWLIDNVLPRPSGERGPEEGATP